MLCSSARGADGLFGLVERLHYRHVDAPGVTADAFDDHRKAEVACGRREAVAVTRAANRGNERAAGCCKLARPSLVPQQFDLVGWHARKRACGPRAVATPDEPERGVTHRNNVLIAPPGDD